LKTKFHEIALPFRQAFAKWYSRDPFHESAVIAYYAILSMPGLFALIIATAGYFLGKEAVIVQLRDQISAAAGTEIADQVQAMIRNVHQSHLSIGGAIISIVTTLVGATGVFAQLQASLNAIWEVKPNPAQSGIWSFCRGRLFSFGLILAISFLLLLSLVIGSILAAMSKWTQANLPAHLMFLFQTADGMVSFVLVSVLFAMMFKFLPDTRVDWKHVWKGAFLTGLLFEVGKIALALYFAKAEPGSAYGAAGAVILILLWVSYSSMVVFFGAELTKAYSEQHPQTAVPR
jgi:membrane protein